MASKTKVVQKNPQILAITGSLEELIEDQNTPQNIRSAAFQVLKIFSGENGSIAERKNRAIQLLEEIISDINIDVCTRTTLFSTISLVESISEREI